MAQTLKSAASDSLNAMIYLMKTVRMSNVQVSAVPLKNSNQSGQGSPRNPQ
jgi:hypothetical protein